jgi:hypothetical protein
MLKHALPATVAALALAAPGAASAQTVLPQPVEVASPPTVQVIEPTGPTADPYEYYYDYDAPVRVLRVPQAAIWIPGHYNWDPSTGKYVWLEGELVQPPHPGAHWIDGHWMETPTDWVWVDGHWS